MEIFSEVLMYVGCGGFILCGVALFVLKVAVPAWVSIRRFFSLPRIQQIVVASVVVGFIQYGATKGGWYIKFDGGIKDNAQNRSVITNNLVNIRWERDTSGGVIVPESATVYIDYKPWSDTNAVWQTLAETTVGQWHYSTMLANATNYAYNVWAYYIPPEPVHTNGVWIYKTLKDRNERYPIPLRARIEVNGKAISTPAEKRKDEGNE